MWEERPIIFCLGGPRDDAGSICSRQIYKGKKKRALGQERQAGDFFQGAGNVLFLRGLEGHDKGQALLLAVRLLQD